MNRLAEINARLKEIRSLLESGDKVDLDALEAELRELTVEKDQIERRQALAAGINAGTVGTVPVENPAAAATDEQRAAAEAAVDPCATVQYRKAFMEFAKNGTPIPEGMAPPVQIRADAFTSTTDAAAVIPTTILDEIFRELKTYGQLFSRVRKLSIRGGVRVPILTLKPQAVWITEAKSSDRQKVGATGNVQFSYYGLECKVAISLLADTVTLPSFETTIVELIAEAMAKALDLAIIAGEGGDEGQPVGITVDPRVLPAQHITLDDADFTTWDGWKRKVFAKIPLSYRAGGTFIMAAGTFEGYIDGMVDDNGQPVGRVNYGITDGPQERFGGREVLLVEDDIVKPYDVADRPVTGAGAKPGDVIAVFCKLSDYAINSNMQMSMYRWMDHDNNQWVDKAILIADGKILDPHGVLVIRKGAALPTG